MSPWESQHLGCCGRDSNQIVSFELAFGRRREEHGQIQVRGTVWSHHTTLAGIRFGSELYRSMRVGRDKLCHVANIWAVSGWSAVLKLHSQGPSSKYVC